MWACAFTDMAEEGGSAFSCDSFRMQKFFLRLPSMVLILYLHYRLRSGLSARVGRRSLLETLQQQKESEDVRSVWCVLHVMSGSKNSFISFYMWWSSAGGNNVRRKCPAEWQVQVLARK